MKCFHNNFFYLSFHGNLKTSNFKERIFRSKEQNKYFSEENSAWILSHWLFLYCEASVLEKLEIRRSFREVNIKKRKQLLYKTIYRK